MRMELGYVGKVYCGKIEFSHSFVKLSKPFGKNILEINVSQHPHIEQNTTIRLSLNREDIKELAAALEVMAEKYDKERE